MYIRIAFSIELRLRVSRSLRSLANYFTKKHRNDNVLDMTFSPYHSLPNVYKLFLVLFQIERMEIKSKVLGEKRNKVD